MLNYGIMDISILAPVLFNIAKRTAKPFYRSFWHLSILCIYFFLQGAFL